jgi:pimeloyl-ACP methyl ester carboxylesterase
MACRSQNGLIPVLYLLLVENLRSELESVSEPVRKALETMDTNGDTVLTLSRIGFIRLVCNMQHKKNEAKYSPEALPFVEFFTPTPAHRQAANDENRALPSTEQSFRDAPSKGFAFPSVVLSHSRPDLFAGMKVQQGVDAAAIAALEDKWQEAQRALAKSLSDSSGTSATQIVVPDAGHCIHHEKPDAIVDVVRALVNEIHDEGSFEGLTSLKYSLCPI